MLLPATSEPFEISSWMYKYAFSRIDRTRVSCLLSPRTSTDSVYDGLRDGRRAGFVALLSA